MKRVVIDTNIWIRILLAGPITLPTAELTSSSPAIRTFEQMIDYGKS
jgi:predicted nucleic acid-binding protein